MITSSFPHPIPVKVALAALTTEDMSPTPRAARVLRGGNHYPTITAFVTSRMEGGMQLATPASLTTDLAELVMDLQGEFGPHPKLLAAAQLVERIDQSQLNAIALIRRGELSPWRQRQAREVAR